MTSACYDIRMSSKFFSMPSFSWYAFIYFCHNANRASTIQCRNVLHAWLRNSNAEIMMNLALPTLYRCNPLPSIIIGIRKKCDLEIISFTDLTKCAEDGSILAIFNGVKPVFIGSANSIWNSVKLLWRYNIDLIRIERYVSKMLGKLQLFD